MEQDYIFPIAIRKENDDIIVRFIDFNVPEQKYENEDDYIANAKCTLANILLEYERQKLTIPPSRKLDSISTNIGEQIIFLNIWLPFYKTENEKYIKKTLTIPEWIDTLAKEQNLNFSHILKEALLSELGLDKEVKKRKILKFNKPMKKLEDFLLIAQNLIKSTKDNELTVFILACKTKDFNLIVTIWTIWVNKKISCFFKEATKKYSSELKMQWTESKWRQYNMDFEEEFSNEINNSCAQIAYELEANDIEHNAVDLCVKYIKNLAECILKASLKYDGIFERDEKIYDYMRIITDKGMLKKLIKKDYRQKYEEFYLFNLNYKIELPHMFILAWNIKSIYADEQRNSTKSSTYRNSKIICYNSLKNVSKTAIEILLGSTVFSKCLEPQVLATMLQNGKEIPVMTRDGNINLSGYLPYLNCINTSINEYEDVFNNIISKEVLTTIPMIPTNIYQGNKIGLKYLIHLLCNELEK